MEAVRVREPLYQIIWAGKDVSKDVSPYLITLRYRDKLHGESDEIEFVFEDRDDRWKTTWFSSKGDVLKVQIGMLDQGIEIWQKLGTFQIEEIELEGPPDVLLVRGKSVFVSAPREQKRTSAFENTTLSRICSTIASRLGLKPVLKIKPDLKFARVDQKEETDLAFLKRLCEQYGYIVKVTDEKLIVHKEEELEKQKASLRIVRGKSNIIHYRFSTKACELYKACEVRYWDPIEKQEIVVRVEDKKVKSGSVHKVTKRAESRKHALELAKGHLKKKNKWDCDSELTLSGDIRLLAGVVIMLEGFGYYDGEYVIEEAEHTLSKSEGYTTSIRIRRK